MTYYATQKTDAFARIEEGEEEDEYLITPPTKEVKMKSPYVSLKYDYIIESVIGNGTYGKVYLVSDSSKKYYAMKSYTELTFGPEIFSSTSTSRFEVDLLSRAMHPNIVSLLNLQIIPTSQRIPEVRVVMELAETNLYDKFQSKSILPLETRRQWIHDFLSGMAFLHSSGYLHCDLKSNNLLIMSDNTLKIADTGLSFNKSDVHHIIERRLNCGIAYTNAPEYLLLNANKFYRDFGFSSVENMIHELPKYDEKDFTTNRFTDYVKGEYYSIGVILLEILCGHVIDRDMIPIEYFRFMIRLCLSSFEKRVELIASFVNSTGEDKDIIIIIAKILSYDPKQRSSPFVDVSLNGYESLNQGRFEILSLPNGKVPGGDYKSIHLALLRMTDRAQSLNYNLYQLSNAMSLLWYILPHFSVQKLEYLVAVCLFMVIRRSIHIKIKSTHKFCLDQFAPELNSELLRELYVDVYQYMNGIIHVESIGDYANDGATLVHSFGYYLNPTKNMKDYVLHVQSNHTPFMMRFKTKGLKEVLVSRSEYLSRNLIVQNGEKTINLGSVIKEHLRY